MAYKNSFNKFGLYEEKAIFKCCWILATDSRNLVNTIKDGTGQLLIGMLQHIRKENINDLESIELETNIQRNQMDYGSFKATSKNKRIN